MSAHLSSIPPKLQDLLDDFAFISDRTQRQDYLIDLADKFSSVRVTPDIASRPYDESHRVPACESDAFVWAQENADGTLNFRFDVLNPQGLSAMAVCSVLGEACSGAPLAQVAAIPSDIVFTLFGKDVSMGKGQGLMGIVNMVTYEARRRLQAES
ncbi:MAG: SufE family protein [Anaerolineae bacterium]|nr:SufE family protein [Anaerolineae bacterium]MDW8173354.1 SufE family protein [Anaerolineae bacterium]